MTQHLQPTRLRQLAHVPEEPVRRPVPVLLWSLDPETLRPVGRWVMDEDRDTAG